MYEDILEELYELLTLYFESDFSPGGDLVKSFDGCEKVEPQLDRVIFKECVLAKITETISRYLQPFL